MKPEAVLFLSAFASLLCYWLGYWTGKIVGKNDTLMPFIPGAPAVLLNFLGVIVMLAMLVRMLFEV